MFHRGMKIGLLALLLISTAVSAATLSIMSFMPSNPQVIYISDLDLLNTNNAQTMFELRVDDPTVTPGLSMRVRIYNSSNQVLATGIMFLRNSSGAALFPTTGTNSWVISNRNISSSHGDWESGENLGSYQEQVLRTGMIPNGTYRYVFDLGVGSSIGSFTVLPGFTAIERFYTLTGMGYLNLMYPPHDPTGSSPISSSLPFFLWQSNQSGFRIKIAEVLEGETPEAAINSRANIDQTVVTGTTFQYPASGVLPLAPNRKYAWRVFTTIHTNQGSIIVPSEIRMFKMAAQTSPEALQLSTILAQLSSLGSFGQQIAAALQNGVPTGVIYINGVPITPQQLMAMLAMFQSGQYRIISVNVN